MAMSVTISICSGVRSPTDTNRLQYWVIRMPNFVKLDSKPFHQDTYVGPEQEDDDTIQQQVDALKERSLSIKLEVENTVRWRWVKGEDGEDVSSFYLSILPVPCCDVHCSGSNRTVE
jgi:hypothetical protein